MIDKYDLVVIGAGPGGYTAAIQAAKLGLKTALVESREIGGTCLNRGCIPTKTLMHSSHLYYETTKIERFGIEVPNVSFDIKKIHDRKNQVVDKIRDGIKSLLKANMVTLIEGKASITGPGSISVSRIEIGADTDKEEVNIGTDKILIATGSNPALPKIEGITCQNVITSDELLSMEDKLYKKLLIIGGGVIGVEFATIYQELGCEVEIIEVADRILPGLDREVSQSVAMNLKKKGVKIHTKAQVVKIEENKEMCCYYKESGKTSANQDLENSPVKTAMADGILICTGRRPNTEHLFGKGFGVEMDGEYIRVDVNFETSVKGIYAIGDVIKGIQLAHMAAAQGIAAVEKMCKKPESVNLSVVPSCIYTTPEVAVTGLSEEEAILKGYKIRTGKYPMAGNAKTLLSMDERSYVKVICDEETDQILGAQIICARATDMIGEFSTAIAKGLTAKDLASVIRPHPTYLEALTEAVLDIEHMAIHLMPS